jgi:hypothetical protein
MNDVVEGAVLKETFIWPDPKIRHATTHPRTLGRVGKGLRRR